MPRKALGSFKMRGESLTRPPPLPLGAIEGVRFYPGALDRAAQGRLLGAVRTLLAEAPPYRPGMPRTGAPLSVRMTNCGPLGWVSDALKGYRYEPLHPQTGRPWPPIPDLLLDLWRELSGFPAPPEACLVNLYDAGARMGMHRDFDELEVRAPVLSVSLGASARFRIGGATRQGRTQSVVLASGDVVLLGGPGRLAYHGIDRILPGTSTLLEGFDPAIQRINLTLRRVTKAPSI